MRSSLLRLMVVCSIGCHTAPAVDQELRAAVRQRALQDQQEMQELVAHWTDSAYHRRVATTLQVNALWLDSIVAVRGWPGIAVADSDGAAAAYLIAQHADAVPAVQMRLLMSLRDAVRAGDALPRELAYLEDRVRKAGGEPQLYGTQPAYDSVGNAIRPLVVAPESLDARRAVVGLPPMAAYLDELRATNARLRAQQTVKP